LGVRSLRIALISTEKLPVPPVAGGAVQLYINGILPYLKDKHEITVFTVKHEKLSDYETINGVRFIRMDAIPKEIYIDNVIKNIGNEFDLIHVFNRPKWVKLISDKLPDVKISLSIHNEMFLPKKISSYEAEECIKRVEFINTVSKFIAKGVEQFYPAAKDKLRVVYSGANTDEYKTVWSTEGKLIKKELSMKYQLEGYKVILFVGRVNEKKGVDILLKAMKSVMKYYPKTALLVVGSNWFGENKKTAYISKLELLAKEMGGKIIFTGFLTPDEVCKHYNLANVFVCPSQWNEPLARVHYEAMAAGLPIITTNRGGNAEVVSGYRNGLVLNNYSNPNSLAEYIVYLLRNPKRARQMGMKGRKLAERVFNFRRVAGQIVTEFNEVEKQLKKGKCN
jgi:spore coat protein SA